MTTSHSRPAAQRNGKRQPRKRPTSAQNRARAGKSSNSAQTERARKHEVMKRCYEFLLENAGDILRSTERLLAALPDDYEGDREQLRENCLLVFTWMRFMKPDEDEIFWLSGRHRFSYAPHGMRGTRELVPLPIINAEFINWLAEYELDLEMD